MAKRKNNPLYRTGKYLIKTKEKPDSRSNKVGYFRPGDNQPWRPKHEHFGPEFDEVFTLSNRQIKKMMAQRNPGKKATLTVKHGKKTLLVGLTRKPR